jgi:hypothetical protein
LPRKLGRDGFDAGPQVDREDFTFQQREVEIEPLVCGPVDDIVQRAGQ